MKKKIYTKKLFERILSKNAANMAKDKKLFLLANKVIQESDKYMFIHQTKFFGEPSLNLPEDLFRIQEIIYDIKPDIILEIGVAWGGSTLFFASILENLKKGRIIGLDIYIPDTLKNRIAQKGKISKRIKLIEGSSLSKNIQNEITKLIKGLKTIIILDSNHTKDHVLNELNFYSKLVSKNSYIICCDTILNFIKPNKLRNREWGPNNNPYTALKQFLKYNKNFIIDKKINNKILFTCNPSGYLKRIK
jgi:cephalosporin hydroxylase